MKRISQFLINLLIFGILNIYLLANQVPLKDLITPVMTEEKPAPGKRVHQVAPEYKGTKVYHTLYLPTDWQKGKRYPVLVEYTGNKFPACGSTGEVKGSQLGLRFKRRRRIYMGLYAVHSEG
jgi:hypothetical protein